MTSDSPSTRLEPADSGVPSGGMPVDAAPPSNAPPSDAPPTVSADAPRPPRSSARRLRWIGLRLGLLLAGLLAGAMIAEAAVRLLGVEPPRLVSKRALLSGADPSVVYHCYSSNPHGEFVPAPDIRQGDWTLYDYSLPPRILQRKRIDETPWAVEYRHSPLGLRERAMEDAPAPGVTRVAVIGDSFVFGEGVPNEKTFVRRLEKRLGDRFEFVNAGRMGAGLEEEAALLASLAAEKSCTRALLVFVPNDVRLTPALSRRQTWINDLINLRDAHLATHESRAWYHGSSRVLRLIGSHLDRNRIHRETIRWYLDGYDPAQNGENLKAAEATFRAIAATPGCRVGVVLFPLIEGFESGYPLQAIHERVAAMATAAGLPVLDLAPEFAGRKTSDLQVHPTDHHPNGEAHEIAADRIDRWIAREWER